MKVAIFSCLGLGDGLLALSLAHNLEKNGRQTTTFHPFLQEAQSWFPHLKISPFPKLISPDFFSFDHYFILYEKSPWMQQILDYCLEHLRGVTTVLNPIATPNKDYPFWQEARFDGRRSFAENIAIFCQNILHLPAVEKSNGITPPKELMFQKYPQRVVIHPTSSREGKNWARPKFLQLARVLEKKGYDPYFIAHGQERKEWPEAPFFESLPALFSFIYESGSMIGNDSGIGHLASCLGLPTLTLCRNERTADFWRPGWSKARVCLPSKWLPNFKLLRLRDLHWGRAISVRRVVKSFQDLSNTIRKK